MTHPAAPTHDELAEWLGYDPGQKARIQRWRDRRGICYQIGADGRVCTTWALIEAGLSGHSKELRLA